MAKREKEGGTEYLIIRRGKKAPEHKRDDDTPSFLKERVHDTEDKKPAPDRAQKGPKVLVMESDYLLMDEITGALHGNCTVLQSHRLVRGIEDARTMLLAESEVDAVVIGMGSPAYLDGVIDEIRKIRPEARIVKLAVSSEYQKIKTGEYEAVGNRSPSESYDEVLEIASIARMSEILETVLRICGGRR